MNVIERILATAQYVLAVPRQELAVPLLLTIPILIASFGVHEGAHWLVGRWFGVRGTLTFLPLRGKSRLWMLSLMGVRFDDDMPGRVTHFQFRLMAAAGPAWDLFFGVVCVYAYARLPVPELVQITVAVSGLAIIGTTLVTNVLPLPLGNDGWRFCFPGRRFGQGR